MRPSDRSAMPSRNGIYCVRRHRPRYRAGRPRHNSRPRRRCRAAFPTRVDAGQSNQVGVIIFAVFKRRQRQRDRTSNERNREGASAAAQSAIPSKRATAPLPRMRANEESSPLDAAREHQRLGEGPGCRPYRRELSRTSPLTPCAPATAGQARSACPKPPVPWITRLFAFFGGNCGAFPASRGGRGACREPRLRPAPRLIRPRQSVAQWSGLSCSASAWFAPRAGASSPADGFNRQLLGTDVLRRQLASASRRFFAELQLSAAASSATGSSAGASAVSAGAVLGGDFLGPVPAPRALAASSASAALAASLLGALLGLLARLGLLRVVARGALLDAGGIEEAGDAVRRLGADAQPVRDAVLVELHPLRVVLGQQRVVGADLLDEVAVARDCGCRPPRCGNTGASWRRRAKAGLKLPFTSILSVLLVYFFVNLSKPGGRLTAELPPSPEQPPADRQPSGGIARRAANAASAPSSRRRRTSPPACRGRPSSASASSPGHFLVHLEQLVDLLHRRCPCPSRRGSCAWR